MRRFAWIFFLVSISVLAGDLKKITRKIEKGELEKAEERIKEVIEANPINPGARYFYSTLYLRSDFRENLDSARIQLFLAKEHIDSLTEDDQKEFEKIGLKRHHFDSLYDIISSKSFDRAFNTNQIRAWNLFLERFPGSPNRQKAIDKRDELVFRKIVETPSIEGFQEFLEDYPSSVLAPFGRKKMDSLLVIRHREQDSAEDLRRFIAENPASEYLDEALDHLFVLSTLSGKKEDYLGFLRAYQEFPIAQRVAQHLYHLDKEDHFELFNEYQALTALGDSLKAERAKSEQFYYPIYDQTIQLMDFTGNQIITNLVELNPRFLCGGVQDDYYAGQSNDGHKIISQTGNLISHGKLFKDLGLGLLLIADEERKKIIHKTGEPIIETVSDADIEEGLLKVKRKKWGIYSLLGKELVVPRYDRIYREGDFWFFEKDGLFAIAMSYQIQQDIRSPVLLDFQFDDYEMQEDGSFIGFRDDKECLIGPNGETVVPWGKHEIYPARKNGYIKSQGRYRLLNGGKWFDYLETNENFVVGRTGSNWFVSSAAGRWSNLDSARIINPYCTWVQDTVSSLFFSNGLDYQLTPDEHIEMATQKHVTISSQGIIRVLDMDGGSTFSGNYDLITPLADSLFLVEFRSKKGVINIQGEEVIPLGYDHIELSNGLLSTLKKGKIGGYDLRSGVSIAPEYDSKLTSTGAYFKTSSGGSFGLISPSGNNVVPFEYDDVIEASDTLVWGQQGEKFHLIEIETGVRKRTVTLLSNFTVGNKTLKKFYEDSGYGLLNEDGRVLLNPVYTDIWSIGNEKNTVIIGEQTLTQAGFKVLFYFDLSGDKLFSKAYSPKEYERLFCDQ